MTFCFVVVVLPIVIVVVNATFSFGKRCWLGKDPVSLFLVVWIWFWWFGFEQSCLEQAGSGRS